MSDDNTQLESRQPNLIVRVLPLLVLLGAGFYAGTPGADVTWVQGDEYLFIVNNPDVTGANGISLIERVIPLFGKVHGDLYQPLPIATYAIEWAVWGADDVSYYVRVTDLLLHLLNGLLVWCLLQQLLGWHTERATARWVGWALALFWTVHPALTRAYAADMGRTHVLSATFGLLALVWFVRYVERRRPLEGIAALVSLVVAMLAKPVVGWFVIAALLVWHRHGFAAMLRDWVTWASLVICGGFAYLTIATSRTAGLLDNVGESLFGDPITRSLLAAFIYVRDSFWPVDLPIWYIPDIATGWGYWPVTVGLVFVAISAGAVLVTLWRTQGRLLAVGVIWYWLYLLPVIGLVGARFSAAGDRYLYQPLVGLLLAVGVLVTWLPNPRARGVVVGVIAVASLGLLPEATRLATVARSMVLRGEDAIARNPHDPRAFEMHGAANSFLADHPEAGGADGSVGEYTAVAVTSLEQAAELAGDEKYFRTARTRADYYRRLSENLQKLGADASSQSTAMKAFALLPDDAAICTRLAHASRVVQDWPTALRAYDQLRSNMPDDETLKIKRLVEHADLLLLVFEDPSRAMPIYREAKELGPVPDRAKVGLARCEVLIGQGAEGYRIALEVLEDDPDRQDAMLVAALYHLRSNQIPEAAGAYGRVLGRWPTSYEGLRGFQEAAGQTGRFADAVMAWRFALEREPGNQVFRSYCAWSMALAEDPQALALIRSNLNAQPNDPFSCLAMMLIDWRRGAWESSVLWAQAAMQGESQPRAREVQRAELAIRLLQQRGAFDGTADVLRGVLFRAAEEGEERDQQIQAMLLGVIQSGPPLDLVQVVQRLLSGPLDGAPQLPPPSE